MKSYRGDTAEEEEVRLLFYGHMSAFPPFSNLKTSLRSLLVSCGPMRPSVVWRTGVVLSFFCLCASLEEECVLGMVGRPVSLPCFTTESLTFENMTMEWRTDRELVLRSVWKDGDVDIWSLNSATFSADAALMGNLTLGLPAVKPKYDRANYSLFIVSGEERLKLLCTICLRIAASFSSPQVLKEDNTSFLCHSSGGYPLPTVYWLINDTEEPPEGSVRTQAVWLPESVLYNVTSLLTVNISQDDSVSCVIENPSINQTVSTVYGVPSSTVVSRASNGMWIFSTALCVVVGIMVLVGVAYQIHLDRVSKRKKKEFQRPQKGYKRRPRYLEEIDVLKYEPKESDV